MHIDKYQQPDGSYKALNGNVYEDALAFLHEGVLGYCGCGQPEESLGYLRDVLQHIHNLKLLVHENKQTYEEWEEAGKALFATEGAEYFMYYRLDQTTLTEHGGSVPGWLTFTGLSLLEDLNEALTPEEEN
jgi:hypothetical protein